jgi:iron(III) transport system ATP-binding protein
VSDLRITGLTKTFDAHRALDDVSIEARDGELLTLLGPSGCGKSTTLWSIAGLHRPDAGTIGIGDDVVFDSGRGVHVPPERRECGVVFQSYAVWPHMTVAENVGYPLRLRRMKRPARAGRVQEVLDLVELGDLADRYPHQLSGGQQQRVALARALAHPPRLLLLDEPFSNFDAKLRDRARVWLRALQREVGVTTVFVTHDQAEALSLSDRVAVLRDGVVHQVDTPEAIYERPADLFVADFVGTVNLLDATVVGPVRDGGWVDVAVDGLAGPLRAATPPPPTPTPAPALTGAVTVAVRPEGIVVHDGEPAAGDDGDDRDDGVVAVPVVDRAYLGDHHVYRVRLADALVTVRATHPAAVVDGCIRIEIPAGRARAYPRREHANG